MAEDSVNLPMTPEVTKSGGVKLRRYSTGKSSSRNSEGKVLPHYLRASTGSCHDFCKYGRKHAFEVKERHSVPKRVARKPVHQGSEESVGGTKIFVAELGASLDSKPTKKTSAVKLRASVDSKLHISETCGTNKQEMPTKSLDILKQVENEVSVNRKKTSLVKIKPSNHLKSHTSDLPKTMRKEISSTSIKVEASKSTTFRAKEIKLSSKPNSVMEKTLSSKNPSKGSSGPRNSELKMEKRATSSKVAARKLITPSRASLSLKPLNRAASINARKHKSLKIVSHLKNQSKKRIDEPKQHSDVEVEEKTLYVINMDDENKTLQSDQNATHDVELSLSQLLSSPKFSSSSLSQSSSQEDQEESEYTNSEVEEDSFSGNHEIEHMENGENLELEQKGMPKKDGVICYEDKDRQMSKLEFIRGKLVEIKSEKSSPRRLKFRRGKVLGENANVKAEAQRKSCKRRDGAVADSIGATTGTEKVVLRHQDVQGSKDAQGLFNNVIEETASKLAETRKSKVKALVGAFETVISLQEKKPSANTVS